MEGSLWRLSGSIWKIRKTDNKQHHCIRQSYVSFPTFRNSCRGLILPLICQRRPKEVPLGYEGTERLREIVPRGHAPEDEFDYLGIMVYNSGQI